MAIVLACEVSYCRRMANYYYSTMLDSDGDAVCTRNDCSLTASEVSKFTEINSRTVTSRRPVGNTIAVLCCTGVNVAMREVNQAVAYQHIVVYPSACC